MIISCEHCKKEFYIRPSDYKNNKYKCCSRECSFKNLNRTIPKENTHGNWKGDKAGYHSIHAHIKRIKTKPDKCELCGKRTDFLDLANISQEYKRIVDDWEYLCRKCHMTKDKRLDYIKTHRGIRPRLGKVVECYWCKKEVYKIQSCLSDKNFCSLSCAGKYNTSKRWSENKKSFNRYFKKA